MRAWYNNLDYVSIIYQFFGEKIKDENSDLGWYIIIIASFASFLTLLNFEKLNLSSDFYLYYGWCKIITIAILNIITTLIGAWIKKKEFVKRIKDFDKQINEIEKLKGLILFEIKNKPDSLRTIYSEFISSNNEKYNQLICYTGYISPSEWDNTIYIITNEYPWFINNKFPWYIYDEKTKKTNINLKFGQRIIKNYEYNKSRTCLGKILYCYYCRCICCTKDINQGNPFDIDKKKE